MGDLFSSKSGRLLRYMPRVQLRRQELQRVEASWDSLALLSSLSTLSSEASSGGDLGRARRDFAALSSEMMAGLEAASVRNVLEHLGAKAQTGIDILVRNLFERTADIGFLATDAVLVAALTPGNALTREAVQARLREYALKYSVYDDILLFDAEGRLCASLLARDGGVPATSPQDMAFLKAVQASDGPYVEHYAVHQFCADPALTQMPTLVYAHRVMAGATLVGVLCLQFSLADEMPAIFNALQGGDEQGHGTVLAIADALGRVIGSSDALQLPRGWVLPQADQTGARLVRYLGREYLLVVRDGHVFQGYAGPGWRGLAMIPLDMAFHDDDEHINSPLMQEAVHSTDLLEDKLRDIPRHAAVIQSALERSVWNGLLDLNRLATEGAAAQGRDIVFARTLLSEIGNTAHKTAQAFTSTLQDLNYVVIESMLRDMQDRASLAMQILDRNLYERANDCRWWALTPQFVASLQAGRTHCADADAVLAYINSLYTVYACLFLFDRQGRVMAVSRPEQAHHVGQPVQGDWARQTLLLETSQDYTVSAFEPSQFSGDKPTFVYSAAVRDPGTGAVLGGIGIVWDAASQLASILADCGEGAHADDLLAFVDATGAPVCSHGQAALLADAAARLQVLQGERIVDVGGALYGAGAHSGNGYREFRARDGYDHGLRCIMLRNLCQPGARGARSPAGDRGASRGERVDADHAVQMATFYVAGHWLGLPASQVLLAAPDAGIVNAGGIHSPFVGLAQVGSKAYPVIDLHPLVTPPGGATVHGQAHARQLIVVRVESEGGKDQELALRVDELKAVLEVDKHRIQPMVLQGREGISLIDAVVQTPSAATGAVTEAPAGPVPLLCRLSQRWLQACAAGLMRDMPPQNLSALATPL